MTFVVKNADSLNDDPKYLMCRKKVHVVDASLVLAGIKVIFFLISGIGAYVNQHHWSFLALVFILPSMLTIVGIHFWEHYYVIPTLIMDAIILLGWFIGGGGLFFLNWPEPLEAHFPPVITVFLWIVGIVTIFGIMVIDYRNYEYIRLKKRPTSPLALCEIPLLSGKNGVAGGTDGKTAACGTGGGAMLYLGLLSLLLSVHALNVTYEPVELEKFRTDETRNLLIKISGLEKSENISFYTECEDTFLCKEIDAAIVNVTIRANFLGFTRLNLKINGREYVYPLRLLRSQSGHVVAKLFASSLTVFLLFVTFMMGTQLKVDNIVNIAKKPIGPVVGFCCQFGLMPTIGFLLASYCLTSQDVSVRLALFAMASSPGGGKSSFWTIIFNGNLDLSIAMTFFQTLASVVMMPLWMKTLGTQFMDSTRVTMPFTQIFKSLLGLLIPSLCGMTLTHFRPQYVAFIQKWIKRVVWSATIFVTIAAVYCNFYMVWLVNWEIFIAACALPWLGYLTAFVVAVCCRQTFKDAVTIAVETGIQNGVVAMVLIYMCLPEPESDIAFTIVFVAAVVTDKPLVCIYLGSRLYHKICKGNTVTQKKGKLEDDESSVEMRATLETEREELEQENDTADHMSVVDEADEMSAVVVKV